MKTEKLKLMTVPEVALLLRQDRMTVYRRSREGSIPGRVKLGTAVRFRESIIRKWIKESEAETQLTR